MKSKGSYMSTEITLSAIDVLLAFFGLFTGGYAGGHAVSLRRLRTEVRFELYASLGQRLRELDDLWWRILNAIDALQDVADDDVDIVAIDDLLQAEGMLRRRLEANVSVLPWTDRASYAQVLSGFPEGAPEGMGLITEKRINTRSAALMLQSWDSHAEAVLDVLRIRFERLGNFQDHLQRRLRPRWWLAPRNWSYSLSLWRQTDHPFSI